MKRVLDFNIGRNKLELDTKIGMDNNEIKMLKEEIEEFYEATTLAKRIDAMIDVRFVFEGTKMKYNKAFLPMDKDIDRVVGDFHTISVAVVSEELGDNSAYLQKIMEASWAIVCDCNDKKTKDLDANGKIIKGDVPNATELIQEFLDEVLGTKTND